MRNYFRITAYNPTLDISYIIDSVGKHENIGQFCVALVKHSRIIEGSSASQFDDGNIPKAEPNNEIYILRACMKGKVIKQNGVININGRYYSPKTGR